MEDTNDDMTGITHTSTGAVHMSEQRIVKVLETFVRLRQGIRDEKRLAAHLRAQVDQLNVTLDQNHNWIM